MALPLDRNWLSLFQSDGPVPQLVRACLSGQELAALPEQAEESAIYCLASMGYGAEHAEVIRAALLRDWLSIFARNGVYLCSTPARIIHDVLEALGFSRVPEAYSELYSQQYPFEGYVLDLRGVGVDLWIEALIGGWPLPAALRLAVGVPDPETLRGALLAALEAAQVEAPEAEAAACRAVELAYLRKSGSHEQAAEELAVSRATFYRLLKRGIHRLAGALTAG